jgi:hypothetical protein
MRLAKQGFWGAASLVALLALSSFAMADGPAVRAAAPASLTPTGYSMVADGSVDMAVDADGQRWAAWTYARGLERDIAVARQIGRTWVPVALMTGDVATRDTQPSLDFMPDGRAIVAFRSAPFDGAPARIAVSVRHDGAWQPVFHATDGQHAARSPHLVRALGGVALVYVDEATQSIEQMLLLTAGDENEPHAGSNGPDPIPTINLPPPDQAWERPWSTKGED